MNVISGMIAIEVLADAGTSFRSERANLQSIRGWMVGKQGGEHDRNPIMKQLAERP
jgi:hypothetical protein